MKGNLCIEEYAVGDLGANCYFVINDDTNEMVVVDPGGNGSLLIHRIDRKGWRPAAVLLTHGHYDHVHHARMLAEEYQIPIYAHKAEKETLADSELNASALFACCEEYCADKYLEDEEILHLAGLEIKVLWTPGHTPGGICYYLPENQILFSGDTLFSGATGRTDLKNGNLSDLIQGIHKKLMVLPDNTEVLPGHMVRTTIMREREHFCLR